MIERAGEWMQTFTGRKFYPQDPRPEDIVIEDIAHHLSLVCRFGGAVTRFYSVAEHSVLVSELVEKLGGTLEEQIWGLLHDASEAYLGDVVWPLKRSNLMDGYRILERICMRTICDAFGLPHVQPPIVKHADLVLLATEKRDLMNGSHKTVEREANAAKDETMRWHCDDVMPLERHVTCCDPSLAEECFLSRWRTRQMLKSRTSTGGVT